jgi:hypothetical protein
MKHDNFTLASGRTIRLHALDQRAVYAGLLEGLPTREMNARTIDAIIREARARTGQEPFLIAPAQTRIEYEGRYPFGEPATLPGIGCVADFVSSGKDPLHYTSLTVIWFQDDYAFPLSAEAAAALTALDWNAHVADQEL